MNPTNPTDPYKIVVLESDHRRRNSLRSMLAAWGYVSYCFEKETICLDNLPALSPNLALCGTFALEKMFRFVASLRLISRNLPLLILTGNPDVQGYVQTNGFAPVRLLQERIHPSKIRTAIKDSIEKGCDNAYHNDCPLMIGKSSEITKIKKLLPELGRSREPILIRGEAGSGKELLAKAIYSHTDRRNRPFVKVHAAELSSVAAGNSYDDGPKSDPSGAYPNQSIPSCMNNGTVFLAGIDFLPADFQVALLQILEKCGNGRGFSINSGDAYDFRIIASTAAKIEKLIDKGRFRKDLYYRLNVLSVTVPPLRDRREDIPLLTDYFADNFSFKLGKGCLEISPNVKTILCEYHWPGNLDELESLIRDLVVSGDERSIVEKLGGYNRKDDCQGIFSLFDEPISPNISDFSKYAIGSKEVSLKDICRIYKTRTEGELIKKALEFNGWNRAKTANLLRISYKSLLNKIKTYGLEKS